MDTKDRKKSIHSSGPLGMLLESGKIRKVDDLSDENTTTTKMKPEKSKISGNYFKTEAGLGFSENELVYIDPKECEPWEYANRQEGDMGDIEELIQSIKVNQQLQPALIRKHPKPHDNVKYEIIFGRRRHIACLKLDIPFLVILKDISNAQDAIVSQDAENKFRNDVSNFSNASLYKRLLADGVFRSERELAKKLGISSSSFNELMSFTKIPQEIVEKIPDIHSLSKNFAVGLITVINQSKLHFDKVLEIAPEIGKTITSPVQLQRAIDKGLKKPVKKQTIESQQYESKQGKKLFTLKFDQRGTPCLVLSKESAAKADISALCEKLRDMLDEETR